MASDAAANAAAAGKSVAGKLGTAFYNNAIPWHQNSRVGKNLLWVGGFACLGIGAALATGGASLPFQTAVSGAVSTNALLAGSTSLTSSVQAAAAKAVADYSLTHGFWSTAGSVAAEVGAHAVNGAAFAAGTALDVFKDGNWDAAGKAVVDLGEALMPKTA